MVSVKRTPAHWRHTGRTSINHASAVPARPSLNHIPAPTIVIFAGIFYISINSVSSAVYIKNYPSVLVLLTYLLTNGRERGGGRPNQISHTSKKARSAPTYYIFTRYNIDDTKAVMLRTWMRILNKISHLAWNPLRCTYL